MAAVLFLDLFFSLIHKVEIYMRCVSGIHPQKFLALSRLLPVAPYLFPNYNDTVFVRLNYNESYTGANISALFTRLDIPLPAQLLPHISNDRFSTQPPGVRSYCLFGQGMNTTIAITYNSSDVTIPPVSSEIGPGDTIVGQRSLEICRGWQALQQQNVTVIPVPGLTHGEAPYLPSLFELWFASLMQPYNGGH